MHGVALAEGVAGKSTKDRLGEVTPRDDGRARVRGWGWPYPPRAARGEKKRILAADSAATVALQVEDRPWQG